MLSIKKQIIVCLLALVLFSAGVTGGALLAKADRQNEVSCYAVLYPYEGYIGVFASVRGYQNGELPFEIIRTRIDALPQADVTALYDGIVLENRDTLRRYTEDLTAFSIHLLG